MISSVSIQAFKSYKNIKDFSLRPLNVLIGPNRSGKSNFLDFWDILSHAGKQQLPIAINKRGGINSIASWNHKGPLKFELDFEAQGSYSVERQRVRYSIDIANLQLSYAVSQERLVRNPQKTNVSPSSAKPSKVDPQQNLLVASSGSAIVYASVAGKHERNQLHLENTSDLAITQIRDAVAYPILDKLRRYLANIAVHCPFDTDDNAPIRNAQPIGIREADVPPTRLVGKGDNLTSVLYYMQNQPEYREYYDEYLLTLQRVFPSLESLVFPADLGQGKTILAWRDREFPKRAITANLLSDGTLRFMCLLAALYDPNPPSLLCIDEPENGLHPQLLRLLAGVLQEASERMQIIISTHSSDLISFLENADDVVIVESEEGWSTLRRLSQQELQHWLQEYSLGELWKSGEIGGRM